MGSIIWDLVILVFKSVFLRFSEWDWLVWLRNFVNNAFTCSFPNIQISTPWSTSMLTHVINKKVFFQYIFYLVWIQIPQISTFQKKNWVWHTEGYRTTCFIILIWIILHIFLLRTWLIFFYRIMWQLSAYFEYSKMLESTVSWVPIEFNWLYLGYYFLPYNKSNSKYC